MTYQTLLVTEPRPGTTLVTLNRPARLNALTFEMFTELQRVTDEVAGDASVRVVVLTGSGRGFCSGLDLDAAAELPDMTTPDFLRGQEAWSRAVGAFRRLRQPVIAAVNGPAAGAGFSLALAADLRLASPEARFNAAFVRIGLSGGDCGSSWTLPRIVGLGLAYEILLTGRFVGADEAARMGLVNRVVSAEALLDEALDLADAIASNSPLGVQLTKQALQVNVDAPSLEAAIELENRNQALASRTQDMREALGAFRDNRPPVFLGR